MNAGTVKNVLGDCTARIFSFISKTERRLFKNVCILFVLFSFPFVATSTIAGSITTNFTNSLNSNLTGNTSDRDASYGISSTGSDLNFAIRDGSDSASFGYRITAQVSTDSTILTGADTAGIGGNATFNFNLPTGASSVALWDINFDIVYTGAIGTDGSGTSAQANDLTVATSGQLGSAYIPPLYGDATSSSSYQAPFYDDYHSSTFYNVTPGTGSIQLGLDLFSSSNGGESMASIGQLSGLSSFNLDDTLNSNYDFSDDGVYLNVTLTPHLNFTGQSLNSDLALNSGEVLSGYGAVSGDISGVTDSQINVTAGNFVLGKSSSPTGFNFNGTLSIGNNTVTLYDSNLAELGLMTTMTGGTLNAANGVALGSGDVLSGDGTVNASISGAAGSQISASGNLYLGKPTSSTGFISDGTLSIGNNTVTLYDSNAAELGLMTTMTGGTLIAANGVALGSSDVLSGYGTVDASISGSAGSQISATSGNLSLGNEFNSNGFKFGGILNVGSNMVTLKDGNAAELGTSTTLSGGVLSAANGISIDGSDTISGYGVVIGSVSGSNYPAGLLIASPTGTVNLTAPLNIGNSIATIYSQNVAGLDDTILSGGTLIAAHGVALGSGDVLSGYGTVDASISGASGSQISALSGDLTLGKASSATGFSFGGTLSIGNNTVTIYDSNAAELGTSTTLSGGVLSAANGISIDGSDTISGYGLIYGEITGSNVDFGLIPTGTLNLSGPLSIGTQDLTLLTDAEVQLPNGTSLDGGSLRTPSGVRIDTGDSVSGHGEVNADVFGERSSTITASNGELKLGNAQSFNGFRTSGNLKVNNGATMTLRAKGFASLGSVTTIEGGTLAAANGVYLGGGNAITGFGSVNGRIAADTGSTITATGNMMIGDNNAFDGFYSKGVLEVGNHTVMIKDRNEGVLGSLSELGNAGGGGTLNASNGLLLNEGDTLAGYGTVNANFINQGYIYGEGLLPADELEFTGYVSGAGDFGGNILFSGTYSPGNSPHTVYFENLDFDSSAILLIEIGGLAPGEEYDQLIISGLTNLDGILTVSLINDFFPTLGDSFEILKFGEYSGNFKGFNGLNIGNGLILDPVFTADSLTLVTSNVPIPSALWLLGSGLIGIVGIRRKFKN